LTLEEAARRLAEAGLDNPRSEARWLFAHVLGAGRDATLNAVPSPGQAEAFDALVARRVAREPFAYITGHKEFWSLDFEVGPGVLVPRPDTETLIEEAIRLVPDLSAPLRIADLGTGSGAILVAALSEFPNAQGIGFESSADAYVWAKRNVDRLVPGRAEVRLEDWTEAPSEGFDLVFCNPPYIPSGDIGMLEGEVRDYEPRAALDGGPDGLSAYRALGQMLPRVLKKTGLALLEIGIEQAEAVEPLFAGLELVRVTPDLSGIPRCVVLRFRGNSLGKDPETQ
jgi:release factor glutamine methyltransferase